MSDYTFINKEIEEQCRLSEANAIREKLQVSNRIPYDFENGKGFADTISAIPSADVTLNIVYSDTPPNDTTKIWVKSTAPSSVEINTKEGIITDEGTLTLEPVSLLEGVAFGDAARVGEWVYLKSYSEKIQKYNLLTNEIKFLNDKFPLTVNGTCCAAVNTDIYFFGGISTTAGQKDIYRLNTINDTLEKLSLQLPSYITAASCINIGTDIYILGSSTNDSILRFNTLTKQIYTLSITLNAPKCCAANIEDCIFAFGGNRGTGTSQIYHYYDMYNTKINLTAKTKEELTVFLPYGLVNSDCTVIGDNIYIFGGISYQSGQDTKYSRKNTIIKFNPKQTTFSVLNNVQFPTGFANGSVIEYNGSAYVFGGHDGSQYLKTIYKYTPAISLTKNKGYIQIQYSPHNNNIKLFNSDNTKMEIGNLKFYLGNENNIAELKESYYYNGTSWVSTN